MSVLSRDEKIAIADDVYSSIPAMLSTDDFRELGRIFCKEYDPMYPVLHYKGMCAWFLLHKRKQCGCPFVSREVCETGRVWM